MTPSRPLKLALVSIEYPPDPFSAGIGTYTQTLAEALVERGHSVHVITRGEGESSTVREAGVSVHRLTPGRPKLPEKFTPGSTVRLVSHNIRDEVRFRRAIAKHLESLIRADQTDIIEASDYMAEAVFFPSHRYPNIPFITRLHTPFAYSELIEPHVPGLVRQAVAWLERRQCLKSSHLSAPSRASADEFRRVLRLGDRPISVYPNPPSYPIEMPPDADEEDPKLVLFVGRIGKWKGAHLLVKAIPKVVAQMPDAKFVFAGAYHAPIDEYASGKDYLLSLLPERYHAHLTFLGKLDHSDLVTHYQKAAVCAFPSLFEAFGYTCLEAMIYGKAIVGSSCGGMTDLLDEGRAGCLYTPPDVDKLAEHILTLLGNPALRRDLGQRARQRARSHYSSEVTLEEIERFYYQARASHALSQS